MRGRVDRVDQDVQPVPPRRVDVTAEPEGVRTPLRGWPAATQHRASTQRDAQSEEATLNLSRELEQWIELAAVVIEVLAVAIIVIATIYATVAYLVRLASRTAGLPAYEQYKIRLGRALLLGLEILVAADIVRTVALEPSLENVGILALLVLIRTFLSWSLVVEIEHRWPWQQRPEEGDAVAASGDTG
jgi:uncharacterized membrane protein